MTGWQRYGMIVCIDGETEMADWYERRDELDPEMVFKTHEGQIVKLDHRVPGDATQWRVATWYGDHWSYDETMIEPGDLADRVAHP